MSIALPLLLAVLAIAGTSGLLAAEQDSPQSTQNMVPIIDERLVRKASADPRNFEGTWTGSGRMIMQLEDPPFLPAGRAVFNHRLDVQSKGGLVAGPHSLCRPAGVISTFATLFPTRVVQTPDKIWIFFEEIRGTRQILIDGQRPKDVQPSYYGHSVARWEGNTLVVDTVGYNGRIWLDNFATPATAQLHTVERVSKSKDGSMLDFEITIEDPGTFSRPFTIHRQWKWITGQVQLPADCEENPSDLQIAGIVYEDETLRPVCVMEDTPAGGRVSCRRR